MNIKNALRKRLLAEGATGHKYGCVMLFLPIKKTWWDKLTDEIDKDDVYNPEGERDYGIQAHTDAHVTILYGCLPSVTDKDVEDALYSEPTPKLTIEGISLFENEDFDVVKFDVKSDGLNKLNKKLSEYPHEKSFDDYHAHITICYAKKGKGKEIIEKLGDIKLDVEASHYIYSKADGTKVRFELKDN
jgi:2'-5' RNA ligase